MKKKLIFLFSIFLLVLLPNVVKAENLATLQMNGYSFTNSNYLVGTTGTNSFKLSLSGDDLTIKYYVYALCSDNGLITSWSQLTPASNQFNIYTTKINCMFPNSSYSLGHIVYMYGSTTYNSYQNCSVQGNNCYIDLNINFTLPNNVNNANITSFALLYSSISDTPYTIDYGTSALMQQNTTIISGQGQINSSISNFNSSVHNDFNSLINNQNTNQQQTHSDLTNINDSLTNDNIPTDSFNGTAFGEWKDLLPSDTPITDLLLLPVNFLSAFIVGFGGTCQPFNLGNFFGTDLILPCINPATYLGSSLWTIIDIICSGLMCFAISKKLIKIWDDMTDMRDNLTNDLYGGGR